MLGLGKQLEETLSGVATGPLMLERALAGSGPQECEMKPSFLRARTQHCIRVLTATVVKTTALNQKSAS